MRNPGRTATTAAALMVGLGLVVFVAVFAAGLKASFDDTIRTARQGRPHRPRRDAAARSRPAPAARSRRSPTSTRRSACYIDQVKVDGGEARASSTDILNGVDPPRSRSVYGFDWLNGDDAGRSARLRGDTALVEEQFAKAHHMGVGDTLTVRTPTGRHGALRVVGVYRDPQILQGVDRRRSACSPRSRPRATRGSSSPPSATAATAATRRRPTSSSALEPFPTAEGASRSAEYRDADRATSSTRSSTCSTRCWR